MEHVRPQVRVFADGEQVAQAAAREFLERASEAVQRNGLFTVALSGGSTPKRLYQLLADATRSSQPHQALWQDIHCFWGDERDVPPAHADSNFHAAEQELFSKIAVPKSNIHRMRPEISGPEQAAKDYEQELRHLFRLSPGELPRFDLVFLGMGADGHTASLFPGSDAVRERVRLVTATWVEKLGAFRMTMTYPVLNHAACVVFLVTGQQKAETLRDILSDERQSDTYPAQLIRPDSGELFWFLDRDAAGHLEEHSV